MSSVDNSADEVTIVEKKSPEKLTKQVNLQKTRN